MFDSTITTTNVNAANDTDSKLECYQSIVNKANPEHNEVVDSVSSNDNNTTTTTTNVKVNHKHSILVSAGSRSASIPSNLLDEAACNRDLSLFNDDANNNSHNTLLLPKEIYAMSIMLTWQ